MGVVLVGVFNNVGSSLGSLANIWRDHHDTFLLVTEGAFRLIFATLSTSLLLITGAIAAALRLAEGTFKSWSLILQGDWSGLWSNIWQTLSDVWVTITGTLTTALDGILTVVDTDLATFLATWSGVWQLAQIAVTEALNKGQEVVDNFLGSLRGLWDWLSSHVFSFKINLPSLPDWAIPGSPTPFERGLRGIAGALDELNAIRASAGGWGGLVAPPATPAQIASNYNYDNSTTNYWAYSPVYQGAPPAPSQDFAKMRVWAR
jgi:hypothetical protein